MRLSQAARSTAPSPTVKLSDMVREIEEQGKKILKFEMGEPQFATPKVITNAAIHALKIGETHYSHSRGLIELRQGLCTFYNRKYKTHFDAKRNVIITPGVKQGLLYVFYALLNRGDHVLVPNPGWASYTEMIQLAGGKAVPYILDRSTNFSVSLRAIQKCATPKTKALIINSPNNPTGRIILRKDLKNIQQWCDKKKIVLISDEIYDRIVYKGKRFASVLDVNPTLTNAIVLNGFSKSYAMTGWRLGYVLAEADLIDALTLFQQNSATCPSTFSQHGALAALRRGERYVAYANEVYERNRSEVINILKKIPAMRIVSPDGGLYVFVDVSRISADSRAFCEGLLLHAGVSVTPGEAFGTQGKGFIRICIAVPTPVLRQGVNRVKSLYV